MVGILVLDPDGGQAGLVKGILESRLNIPVFAVSTDEDAVGACWERKPSLLIVSPSVSESDTKEVIEVMRETDPAIPVIMISEGCSDEITKIGRIFPIHPAELRKNLLNVVRDALGQERSFIVKRRRLKGLSEGQSGFYIDLLTHDISNINQGVMGYLELLSVLPETSERQRKYVSDSIGLLRMSMILLDNVRKDFSSTERTKSVELEGLLKEVTSNIREINPLRRIDVDLSEVRSGVKVIGSDLLPDMFLQLMDFMIQRSKGSTHKFKIVTKPCDQGRISIQVHCGGTALPEDSSKLIFQKTGDAMGKLSICKRIAERLGGNVDYSLGPALPGFPGSYFKIDLKVMP